MDLWTYNFISKIDRDAKKTRYKHLFYDVVYDSGKSKNKNFVLRRDVRWNGKTRILFIKNGVRVRFTDNDVMQMLISIKDKSVVDDFYKAFKEGYKGRFDNAKLKIDGVEYGISVLKLDCVNTNVMLENLKDIPIDLDNLIVLINLIIAKDNASAEAIKGVEYVKRTLAKYILILEKYYYHNKKVDSYFETLGMEYTLDFANDFIASNAADDNIKKITDYNKFEKSGII